MSSFPRNSAFYQEPNRVTNAAGAFLRARAAESAPSREHKFIAIEQWVLEDWANALQDAAMTGKTAGMSDIERIADEISGYLDS